MPPLNLTSSMNQIADQVVVIDDVLSGSSIFDLRDISQNMTYESVSMRKSLSDIDLRTYVERGPTFHLRNGNASPALPPPIECILEKLRSIGSTAKTNLHISTSIDLTIWKYGLGSAMYLHSDGPDSYLGSFIYWFHDEWRLDWGGHLLIFNDIPASSGSRTIKEKILPATRENKYWDNDAVAMAVLPKPNRLVYLPPTIPHMVTQVVDSNAKRLSVTGFFIKQNVK